MPSDPDAARQAALWDRWSQSVPRLYPDRDPSRIVHFLGDLVGSGVALELGAGDGRVAIPLTRTGASVMGLEISSGLAGKMRAASVGLDLTVVEADMAEFSLQRSLDLAYCVRSTFFHLGTQERQLQCLKLCAQHLAPDGLLVLDCFVPDLQLLQRGSEVTVSGYTDDSVELRACSVEPVEQRIVYREIRLTADAPVSVLPAEQRFCWPSELDLMAHCAGFVLRSRFGDFEGLSFSSTCDRHVSVYAKRAHPQP